MKTFELKQLHFVGLESLDLQLLAGQILAVTGPSGCGKSRLLRALADLDETEGEVFLDGTEKTAFDPEYWRKQVGLLPADSLWWHDHVIDHFPEGYALDDNAKNLGLGDDILSWEVGRLSSGEKQRLALLRLLANKPQVCLLDEPTANLDEKNTRIFEDVVRDYLHTNEAAAIWVSHDLSQLQRVSDQCYVMADQQLRRRSECA